MRLKLTKREVRRENEEKNSTIKALWAKLKKEENINEQYRKELEEKEQEFANKDKVI